MAKKSMAQLLEDVTKNKAFKSDDTVSEIEAVGLDKTGADDELEELEVDGKSKAGLSAEEKTKKASTKSVSEEKENPFAKKKDDDKSDSDKDEDEDEDEDEEDDKELEEAKKEASDFEVRKVTVEDFDSSSDLEAIFGSDETLSEGFVSKAKNIYDASVIAKANEVIQGVYGQMLESFNAEQGILVSELNEAYNAKVEELTESIDRYLNKSITDWKKENEVALVSKARFEIAESFMGKLKTLFEDHYIDMPDEKVSVVEGLEAKVAQLEEQLQKEVDRNIALKEEIEGNERTKIIADLSEGLSDAQKEKFGLLAEGFDSADKTAFIEKLNEVKTAYFSKKTAKIIKEEVAEPTLELKEDVVAADPVMSMFAKYLNGKK